MIGLPVGTRIWIAAGVTYMRRGFHGLSAQVQMVLVLWFDDDGLCLLAKRLERGRFVWPQASSGTVCHSEHAKAKRFITKCTEEPLLVGRYKTCCCKAELSLMLQSEYGIVEPLS